MRAGVMRLPAETKDARWENQRTSHMRGSRGLDVRLLA